MSIKETIRAEIDKLYGEYKDKFHQSGDQYHLGLIDGLDMAERVLDSLPEQPVEGLEEAAKEYTDGKSWAKENYLTPYIREAFIAGAEWQYQKDRVEFAKLKAKEWSDGYNEGIARGKEQAEQDLGWHSVEESLPEMDEEVIVLKDKQNTGLVYEISFGHLVDTERCIDYNGWNVPDVKFWMPMPEIVDINTPKK